MITIEVQLEPHGDPVPFLSPMIVEYGDRVVVPANDTLAVGYVVGVGSSRGEATEEIIRVLGPLEGAGGGVDW